MKEICRLVSAPKEIGAYSQVVAADTLLFFSGQLPIDISTGELVKGGIEEKTRVILDNVKHMLEEMGLTMGNIVKATIYLRDLKNFPAVNAVYGNYFTEDPPARCCLEVSSLPLNSDIEIEFVAAR